MTQAKENKTAVTAKAKEREQYYVRKEKLVALEAKNYSKIVFMRGMGGFWVVLGHSAVILANKVGPAMKMWVPLKKDTDYRFKSKEGVIAVKNLGFYKTALKDSSLTKLKTETEDALTFELKEKLTAELYDLVLHEQEIKRQQIANSILKAVPMPKTNMRLNDTMKLGYKLYCEYSDTFCREVFAGKLMDELRVANKVFILACRDTLPFEVAMNEVEKNLNRAAASLALISEMGLWNTEKCMSLAGLIAETLAELAAERKMVARMIQSGKVNLCTK